MYCITIPVCMIIIAGVNILINSSLYNLSILYIILAVVIGTVAVIAIDGLFAFIIRRLPEKWFSYKKKIFNVGKREVKFYEAIGIKKWKDKVLELGQFTNFTKKKVVNPFDNEYVERFLMECNYGYIIHLVGIFMGFLIIFIFPLKYALMFGVPIGVVNAVLNYLPMCILRYNTPKLLILHKRNERNEALNKKKEEEKEEIIE